MPRIALLLVLASSVWLLAILTAPIVAARETSRGVAFRAAALTYIGGSVICHQRPERSFHLRGSQLPVCARCTGLYAAAPLGALAAAWPLVALTRRAARPAFVRWLLALAVAPIASSVAAEAIGLWTPSNVERFFTALPAGFLVAWTAAAASRGHLR